MKFKSENTKYWIAGGALALVVVIATTVVMTGYNPWATDTTTTPTPLATSTFELYSGVDGEDVSNFVEMDIWVPKDTATFDEGYEDITALTSNFERKETGKDADDISLDLRTYSYVWAEITGNTVFENTFHLIIPAGINKVHPYNVHHSSSAVPFNILTQNTGLNISVYTETIGGGVDGNYTGVLMVPISFLAAANCHYGDNWDLSTTAFGELTATQQEFYWDQGNWRDQYPIYDPTADTVNEYDRDFEKITDAFSIKIVMNTTINVTDTSDMEVNCTIAKGYPIETLISGDTLYLVWYEGFNFLDSAYTFDFELSFGANITVTTAYSGRVLVPGSLSSLSTYTVYNEIGLVAA